MTGNMNQKNFSPILKSEEDVKIHFTIPMLEKLGYKTECMSFEQTITITEGKKKKSIFADIVVYTDKKKETPLLVVDTKSPNEILSRSDKEQVISYARLLNKIAPIAVLTNSFTTQIYQTLDKTRIKNLPHRKIILKDFVSAVISSNIQNALRVEATKELFIIDDVNTFKDLLKKCHNTIRNNEGYDPIQAFDELSKVLFAKMYEEQNNKDSNRFTTEIFDNTLEQLNVNIVQQQFQEIQKTQSYKDLFPVDTRIELHDRTIKEIVTTFEKYDLTLTKFDVKGEAFEYFLSDTFTGGLGEYFTPRNVVEFIVESISPKIGEKIIDPFCGTGGFLIYAFDIIGEKIRLQDFSEDEKSKWRFELSNKSLYGTDWKPRTSQACKMNMIVHGDGNTGIFQHNGFVNIEGFIEENLFDICFTNPPFGANETDKLILNEFELGAGRNSQKREILAIERCIKLVKPETGVVAIVLPDGLLNGDSLSYVREYINKEATILAVVGLNKETFEGYNATAKTSIVYLKRKKNPSDKLSKNIFMAVCTNSGYAPTGQQIPGNQLPDILFDLKNQFEGKNFEPIFSNVALVSLKNPKDRIDAERYITIAKDDRDIQEHTIISDNLIQDLEVNRKLYKETIDSIKNIYQDEDFEYIQINQLIAPCFNKINIISDHLYVRLGLRGSGAGFIKKDAKKENKTKYLNQVKKDWLVYSRLFARDGSFAYVDEAHEGCCLSNEFPTFEVINKKYDKILLLEYLVFYLTSPQSIEYINRLTTGTTKQSRSRFKENQLLSMNIPIPKKEDVFNKVSQAVKQMKVFQKQINEISLKINKYFQAVQFKLPSVIDQQFLH